MRTWPAPPLPSGTSHTGLLAVIPFGLPGAAWGFLAATLAGAALSQRVLHRAIGLRFADVLQACLPSLYITLITVAPVAIWAAIEGIGEHNFARFAVVGGIVTAAGWILAIRFLRHPLWHEVVKVGALIRASTGPLLRR